MDWRTFVETISMVDKTLAEDPSGIYGSMDFASRDSYRHAVERIAGNCEHAECAVAHSAIHLAREAASRTSTDDPAAHVGFYLVDDGLAQLEHMVGSALYDRWALRKARPRFPACCLWRRYPAGNLAVQPDSSRPGLIVDGLQGWPM